MAGEILRTETGAGFALSSGYDAHANRIIIGIDYMDAFGATVMLTRPEAIEHGKRILALAEAMPRVE